MELSIIQKTFTLQKDAYAFTHLLPKEHKFAIGKGVYDSSSRIYELVLYAKHNPKHNKHPYLLRAIVEGDILKSRLRLCLELNLGNPTTIFKLNNQTTEIQKMLSGWKKSL